MLNFLNKKEENFSEKWINLNSQIVNLFQYVHFKEGEFFDVSLLEPLFKDKGVAKKLISNQEVDDFVVMGLCHVLACFSSSHIDLFFKKQAKILNKLKAKESPLASILLKVATKSAFNFRTPETNESEWYDRFLTQFTRLAPTFDLRNTLKNNQKNSLEQNSTISLLCQENHIEELKVLFSHGCNTGLQKEKGKFFDDNVFHHFSKNNYSNKIGSVECLDLLLKNGFNIEEWNQKLIEVAGSNSGFAIKSLTHLIKQNWSLSHQLIEKHQKFYNLSSYQMEQWHLNTLMDSNIFDRFSNKNDFEKKLTDGYVKFLYQKYPDFLNWAFPTNYKINEVVPDPINIISVKDYLKLTNREDLLSELLICKNLSNQLLPIKNNTHRF